MDMVFMLRIILIIVIFVIIVYVIRISSAQKKAKRISNYAIDPVKSDYYSYSDRILNSYYKFVKRMRPLINKSFYLKKSAKKYEKYISYDKHGIIEGYDFIITNPPIRAGKNVIRGFLLGSYDYLKDDGILYFVMRKDHGVKSMIKELSVKFNTSIVNKDKGFYVVLCTKK